VVFNLEYILMKRYFLLSVFSMASLLIGGCAGNVSPNSYDAAEAGIASKVVQGVIIGKRKVKIDGKGGVGGLAGAGMGAVGGSAIGGGDRSHIAGAIGGAVLGGVIGDQIDKRINQHQAYEYIIRLKNGSTISIAQVQELEFAIHQPVLVIYGAMTRIVPDECVEFKNPQGMNKQRGKAVKEDSRA
jgi:outer membrane lipoprotein SlyB